MISAKRAANSGLVDQLVKDSTEPLPALLKEAKRIAKQGKARSSRTPLLEKLLGSFAIGRGIVEQKARAKVLKETKGNYPAPLLALERTVEGLGQQRSRALKKEAAALGELAVSAESKGLVHVFEATEAAKKIGRGAGQNVKSGSVVVLGAGTMGLGIASCFLQRSCTVHLVESSDKARDSARSRIEKSLSRRRSLSEDKREKLLNSLHVRESTGEVTDAALLVEAIIEDLEIKQNVLSEIVTGLPDDCIIATNTSSLSISEIAAGIPGPGRVAGMHFFNPAEKMPLVEIIRGEETEDWVMQSLAAFCTGLSKFPVVVADVPGFLVNRCLSPYIAEAGALLAEGYSVEQIDKAAVDFGMPMGPFRMLDEVGLDVAAKVQEVLTASYGERMAAEEYPELLVKEGRKGKKTGAGFYSHEGKHAEFDSDVYSVLGLSSERKQGDEKHIQNRLLLPLVRECILCLDEAVAGAPGSEAATQIDLASVMGTGFAPFRGGAIFYAESLGAPELLARLDELRAEHGVRFEAHERLRERAERSESFYS